MEREIPLGLATFAELMDGEIAPVSLEEKNFPLWIPGVLKRIFAVRRAGQSPLAFIEPSAEVPFDRISAIAKTVQKQLGWEPVIIADGLNPRFRSLFIRDGIAFVRGRENIFAPRILGRLSNLENAGRLFPGAKADTLAPFALKIVAGALTGFLSPERLKVNEITGKIKGLGASVAASKVSVALRELKDLGLADESGKGPEKSYALAPKETAFWELLRIPHDRFFKRTRQHLSQPVRGNVLTGESALAAYGNLAEPKAPIIAIHRRKSGEIPLVTDRTYHHFDPIEIEFWKEDPTLFAIEGRLNPIELVFSLLPNLADPRVHLELNDVLMRYGLRLPEGGGDG